MVKITVAFAIILGLMACDTVRQDPTFDYVNMEKQAVLVALGINRGSGVIIGPNIVLTSSHVVSSNDEPITVEFYNGDIVSASRDFIGARKTFDVAILTLTRDVSISPAEISCRKLDMGEMLVAYGHPMSGRWITSLVRVASTRIWGDDTNRSTIVQGPLLDGMSGGPIFDISGKVVGISHGYMGLKTSRFSHSPSGWSVIVPATQMCENKEFSKYIN